MTASLRIVLVAQLAFFALWGGHLLTSHRGADVIWLATEPVDPRDLLAGHFVALRYPIAVPSAGRLGLHNGDRVFVRLAPSGKTVATTAGDVEVSSAVEWTTSARDVEAGKTWIVGTVDGQRGDTLVFGIERFFVPEDSPLRNVRGGDVVAKVAINASSQPRIVDLVPTVK